MLPKENVFRPPPEPRTCDNAASNMAISAHRLNHAYEFCGVLRKGHFLAAHGLRYSRYGTRVSRR
jgi:hypothetical protein